VGRSWRDEVGGAVWVGVLLQGFSQLLDGPVLRYSLVVELSPRASDHLANVPIGGFGASCCLANEYNQLDVEDRVDNSVVADAQPVEVLLKVNGLGGSRIIAKRAHGGYRALSILSGHVLKLLFDIPMELE
jgi:hypothetical protein